MVTTTKRNPSRVKSMELGFLVKNGGIGARRMMIWKTELGAPRNHCVNGSGGAGRMVIWPAEHGRGGSGSSNRAKI